MCVFFFIISYKLKLIGRTCPSIHLFTMSYLFSNIVQPWNCFFFHRFFYFLKRKMLNCTFHLHTNTSNTHAESVLPPGGVCRDDDGAQIMMRSNVAQHDVGGCQGEGNIILRFILRREFARSQTYCRVSGAPNFTWNVLQQDMGGKKRRRSKAQTISKR